MCTAPAVVDTRIIHRQGRFGQAKAMAQGAIPKGRELEPHRRHFAGPWMFFSFPTCELPWGASVNCVWYWEHPFIPPYTSHFVFTPALLKFFTEMKSSKIEIFVVHIITWKVSEHVREYSGHARVWTRKDFPVLGIAERVLIQKVWTATLMVPCGKY